MLHADDFYHHPYLADEERKGVTQVTEKSLMGCPQAAASAILEYKLLYQIKDVWKRMRILNYLGRKKKLN